LKLETVEKATESTPEALRVHRLGNSSACRSFFLPVLITTAPLYTLRYEPTEIPLETGSYDTLDPKEIEQIPWVRFHKTLTADAASGARTVFVVNSAAVPMFLDEISRAQGFGPGYRDLSRAERLGPCPRISARHRLSDETDECRSSARRHDRAPPRSARGPVRCYRNPHTYGACDRVSVKRATAQEGKR